MEIKYVVNGKTFTNKDKALEYEKQCAEKAEEKAKLAAVRKQRLDDIQKQYTSLRKQIVAFEKDYDALICLSSEGTLSEASTNNTFAKVLQSLLY